ncbi:MAG: beta-lactamase family protein [Haliscomenobacter sp.]|nr:beta-lactamase family protein [Haliscomenobacter sp.]
MPFNLASVAKQFVTMGIMILKEERRLDYDDDVRFHLRGFPYAGITIRHLMTHTSGLTEYFELWEKHAPQDRIFSNHDLLKMYQNLKTAVGLRARRRVPVFQYRLPDAGAGDGSRGRYAGGVVYPGPDHQAVGTEGDLPVPFGHALLSPPRPRAGV